MNMDFSDSFCENILRASAAASTSLLADPSNASILTTQFQNVKDQRVAMASKIHAKFRVAGADNEAPLAIHSTKNVPQKFVTFDPHGFEQDKQLSLRDQFEASEGLKKLANMIRDIIHKDLSLAHADNVCKLHEQFDRREGRDLQALCNAGSSLKFEVVDEEALSLPFFEEKRKFLVVDFDMQNCDACYLDSEPLCVVVDQPCACDLDEMLHEAESVFKLQFDIIQNFRLAEANSTSIIDDDFCTPVDSGTSFGKFICVSNLEYCPHDDDTRSCCALANASGFCASVMMSIVQEHSSVVDLPAQPILVCAEYGHQNYPSLVGTCASSNVEVDDCEEFSLLVIDAFPYEPLAAINVRSFRFQIFVCVCLVKS